MKTEQFHVYDPDTGMHYAGPFYSRRLAEQAKARFTNSTVGTEDERQTIQEAFTTKVVFTINDHTKGRAYDKLFDHVVDASRYLGVVEDKGHGTLSAPWFEELAPSLFRASLCDDLSGVTDYINGTISAPWFEELAPFDAQAYHQWRDQAERQAWETECCCEIKARV